MADTIEALLQENHGKVQSLLQSSERLTPLYESAVGQIDENMQAAVTAVGSSLKHLEKLDKTVQSLEELLENVESDSASGSQTIEDAVDGLAGQIEQSGEDTERVFEPLELQVKQSLIAVGSHETTAITELQMFLDLSHTLSESYENGMEGLGEKLSEITERLTTGFDEAVTAAEGTAKVFGSFQQQHTTGMKTRLVAIGDVMKEAETQMQQALTQLGQEANEEIQAMHQIIDRKLDTVIAETHGIFAKQVGQATDKIDSLGDPTIQTLGVLSGLAKDVVTSTTESRNKVEALRDLF